MKLLTIGIAVLTLQVISVAPGSAQPPAKSAVLADHTLRAGKLLGAPVYNASGEQIGTIDDILVDPNNGVARAVLAIGKYIGTESAMVAVPLGSVRLDSGRAMMPNATKTSLAAMQPWRYHSELEDGGH